MEESPKPPKHRNIMDIAFSMVFKYYPKTIMELAAPGHIYTPLEQIPAEIKAIQTTTDNAWCVEVDGEKMICVMEEMTQWDDDILLDILKRKVLFAADLGLPPFGIILLPEKVNVSYSGKTRYILGKADMANTTDENYIIQLADLDTDFDPEDPGQVLMHLFSKKVDADTAFKLAIDLEKIIADEKLLVQTWQVAQIIIFRRFGEKALDEFWKRIQPMLNTDDKFFQIAFGGQLKKEWDKQLEKQWLNEKVESILQAIELRFEVTPGPEFEEKLMNEDKERLNSLFKISQKATSYDDFRNQAGL